MALLRFLLVPGHPAVLYVSVAVLFLPGSLRGQGHMAFSFAFAEPLDPCRNAPRVCRIKSSPTVVLVIFGSSSEVSALPLWMSQGGGREGRRRSPSWTRAGQGVGGRERRGLEDRGWTRPSPSWPHYFPVSGREEVAAARAREAGAG